MKDMAEKIISMAQAGADMQSIVRGLKVSQVVAQKVLESYYNGSIQRHGKVLAMQTLDLLYQKLHKIVTSVDVTNLVSTEEKLDVAKRLAALIKILEEYGMPKGEMPALSEGERYIEAELRMKQAERFRAKVTSQARVTTSQEITDRPSDPPSAA